MPIVQVLADFTGSGGPPAVLVEEAATPLDAGDGRTISRFTTQRGRTYELAGSQAGTATIQVDDPAETLNPANQASPLATNGNRLALYRAVGIRAWWPRTGNWLDSGNYSGYHPGFEASAVTNGWTSEAGTASNVATDPQSGTRCLQLVLDGPVATARPLGGIGYRTIPGRTYTYSVWVRRGPASTGTTIRVSMGGASSTTTSSTAWARLQVTFVATQPRTPLVLTAEGGPAGAGAQLVFVDAEQLELGDQATAWQATGPVQYALYTGYIERYPQTWADAGFRGMRPLESADALAALSRTKITTSYAERIRADEPALYLPLDDQVGPGTVSGPLAGSVNLAEFPSARGGSISWGGDTLPDGDRAVVLSQQLQNPADVPLAEQFTELDTRAAVGPSPSEFALITTGATMEFWLRIEESIAQVTVGSIVSGEFHPAGYLSSDARLGLTYNQNGSHRLFIHDGSATNGFNAAPSGRTGFVDKNWHYYALTLSPTPDNTTTYRLGIRLDEVGAFTPTGRPHRFIGVNSVHIDARTLYGDLLTKLSVARLAIYTRALTDEQLAAHYLIGVGYRGETPSARATRMLADWWGGPVVVHPGTKLALPADTHTRGGSVLAALEDLANTDEGFVYADAAGRVVVESRRTRHLQSVPGVVFGENAGAGEIPYVHLEYDYDPNYVYGRIEVTRPGRSDPLVLVDETVVQLVGPRAFSKTINVENDFELMQAALYLRHRYGQARLRVKELRLDPAANPSIWPTVLGLELSRRVRVRRRTTAVVVDDEYYIESLRHEVDAEAGTWEVVLELSPVFVPAVWVLGDPVRGVLGQTTVPVY